MTTDNVDPRYSRAEAAAYLGISIHTLHSWASSGQQGLRFYRVGRRCIYLKSDLDAYLAASAVGSKKEAA